MADRIEMRRDRKGRIYSVRQKESGSVDGLITILGAILAYLSFLAIIYGVLSFNRPDLIKVGFENKDALVSLLFGAGMVVIAFTSQLMKLGSATFERANSPDGRVSMLSSMSAINRWVLKMATGIEFTAVDDTSIKKDGAGGKEEVSEKEDLFSYGAVSCGEPFELYCSSILKSLSAYATASENTATKLLDKGVGFMAGGLIFYVLAIVIWQVFANLTHPDPNVMYVGMAACSMTFVVVEFLAAWFFKQYRYYVEVSMACLRVRSGYDRYLLGYYALREFKGESDQALRDQMTAILKEDVKWPTYKAGVANDFNYMIESMSTAHTTLEKMKDLFQSKKVKPKPQDL
ncbi:hypothetical protein AO260_15165 [Pseudomonas sp. ABAC21]|nr:hypothetical protein AO260_15165 [Pseudomonas sp. ABAC21]